MASPQARAVVGRLLGWVSRREAAVSCGPGPRWMCCDFYRMEIVRGLLGGQACCMYVCLYVRMHVCMYVGYCRHSGRQDARHPQPLRAHTHFFLFPMLHACGPAEAALASRITQGSAGMTPSPRQGVGRGSTFGYAPVAAARSRQHVACCEKSMGSWCVRSPLDVAAALGRASILPHRCRIGTGLARTRFVTNALPRCRPMHAGRAREILQQNA